MNASLATEVIFINAYSSEYQQSAVVHLYREDVRPKRVSE